jgi:3-isopropylmalate/(R)-2-methylmalate dehydratase large subunit
VTKFSTSLQMDGRQAPQSLFEKLWQLHLVEDSATGPALLYVDRHLVYEVTSPQAFEGLRASRRRVWRPETVLGTADHNVPTTPRHHGIKDPLSRAQVEELTRNCKEFGIREFGMSDPRQGIIHVVGPEQGATLPGMTVVAGDSHTSTHGAMGALAFGVGTSDVEHVLATQCLRVAKMRSMLIKVHGRTVPGVTAKDVILFLIGRLGTGGATGHAVEFCGETLSAFSMEARMTICNMAIELGARVGLVAVDDKTIDYVRGRAFAPEGQDWDLAVAHWRSLVSDEGAHFDVVHTFDAADIRPMVTWGTSPEMVTTIDGVVPDPLREPDAVKRSSMERALSYMGLEPGTRITEIRPDKVFIGSCTNARIEDLRAAASVVLGQHVAPGIVQALVVPGSGLVKRQAEDEGLHRVFTDAGFEWREAGCSMCLGMNEDALGPGERCASTSNRNFEGRQGGGGRSHLVSPSMAAAAAIAGHFVDVSKIRQ